MAIAVTVAILIAALTSGGASGDRASRAFAWLQPAPPPAGWTVVRTSGGATLAYPPGWTAIRADPGTTSAALLGRGRQIEAYLNATPKQGTETLANWGRFRVRHNRGEGARHVHLLAETNDAHFRSARGSCVIDRYTTSKTTYREIACLASGRASSAVVVAAAPDVRWHRQAATLERAVSSFVP